MADFNPFAGESTAHQGAVTASNSDYKGTPTPPTPTIASPITPSNTSGGTPPASTPPPAAPASNNNTSNSGTTTVNSSNAGTGNVPVTTPVTNTAPTIDQTFGKSTISTDQMESNRQGLISEGNANPTLDQIQIYKPKTQVQKDQDKFNANLKASNDAIANTYKNIQDLFTKFQNGSIPLTSQQQSLVDIMTTNMNNAVTAQQKANKDYTAGIEQMGAAAGRNRYAPEIEAGNIYNSVQMGLGKVAELQNTYLQKKYEMQSAMEEGNYNKMMTAYDSMLSSEKDQRDTMINMEKLTRDYAKQQNDDAYRAQQDALARKQAMTMQGYSYISDPSQLAGLTEDQIVRIGNEIYKKPTTTKDQSSDVKDYEYAKNSGYTGSFMDYLSDKANLKESTGPTESQVLTRAKYLQSQDVTLSDEEALQEARSQLSGSNNFKDNEKTDLECGEFINQTAGMLVGTHWKEKKDNVSKFGTLGGSGVKVGDVVYQDVNTNDGHVALVTAVSSDGSVVVDEANYKNDGKISKGRTIAAKDIYGYIDPSQAPELQIKKSESTDISDNIWKGISKVKQDAATKISTDFENEPVTKSYNVAKQGYDKAMALSNDTKNPSDDQALIYAFAKVMDPDSVVREGEYATVQKYAQSWIKAYGKGVEQAMFGTGFLSKEARQNIKKTLESTYGTFKGNYTNIRNEKAKQIDNVVGKPIGDKVLVDYSGGNKTQADSTTDSDPLGLFK